MKLEVQRKDRCVCDDVLIKQTFAKDKFWGVKTT